MWCTELCFVRKKIKPYAHYTEQGRVFALLITICLVYFVPLLNVGGKNKIQPDAIPAYKGFCCLQAAIKSIK